MCSLHSLNMAFLFAISFQNHFCWICLSCYREHGHKKDYLLMINTSTNLKFNQFNSWIKLLRISHWVKNLLVFFPVTFAGKLFNLTDFSNALLAFLCFSLASSSVYIFNDIRDAKADKTHPTKKHRPLASGDISLRSAIVVSVFLLVCATTFSFIPVSSWATITLFFYIALNVGYSLGLKNVPIVDIAILASGFVLRVIFGGIYCEIPISLWLFLTILSFATYFACGKRNGELLSHGATSRKTLELYTSSFLKQGMNVSLAIGLVFYSLWSYESVSQYTTFVSVSSLSVVLGVPLVMLICFRYNYILTCTNSDGDPVDILLHDKALVALLACWIATICCSIYMLG